MYVELQSQAQLGNKTTRISTFQGGSSSNSTCTSCPLLHAAWCILHASQNMPQLVKQETDGEGRGSEAAPLKVENIQANESRLVSFRSSRCALQVPTSSALIVTLFAHLKDTDAHIHTHIQLQHKPAAVEVAAAAAAAPLEHLRILALLAGSSSWVVSNNLRRIFKAGSSSGSNLNMHHERTSERTTNNLAATSGSSSVACNTQHRQKPSRAEEETPKLNSK